MTTNSNVNSNAFNYPVKGSVDDRTGQYVVSIELPELLSNSLNGPDLPISLDYSPLNLDDSGYGIGWTLRLSQYHVATSMLTLVTGDSYKVTGTDTDGQPVLKEQKIDGFRLLDDGNDTWRIVHRSGLVEVLKAGGIQDKRIAVPHRIYAPTGHSIELTWASFNGGERLASVRDASGDLLRIQRADHEVKLLLPPFDDKPLTRYLMKLTGSRVMEIVLPVEEQASWRFTYAPIRDRICITSLKTPQGAHETIEYLDEGHRFPGLTPPPNLPRVTRHLISPGHDKATMETRYEYSNENFLGNGANISWENNGLDQLYNVTHTYEYDTTARHMLDGQVLRTVKRLYNRFHLLTEETITQGQCIKKTINTYHDEDVQFDQQPANFQSPHTVENRWEMANDATKVRSETATTEFDRHGNLVLEIKANGISKRTTYYDKDGEDGCPPDPLGFVRCIKETVVTPPADALGDAPVVITRYRYKTLQPLDGTPVGESLTVCEDFLYEKRGDTESLVHHNLHQRYETPDNPYLHGRLLQTVSELNGTSSTIDYVWGTARNKLLDQDSLHCEETFNGFDGISKTMAVEQSLLHGEPLLGHDDNGVQVLHEYDGLHRLVRQTVAPETEFVASRTTAYQLVASDGQHASETLTTVKGLQTRNSYDGVGHLVLTECKQGDDWRAIYSAVYDGMAQLSQDTRHDWIDTQDTETGETITQEITRTTTYQYDDWGQRCRATGPDGVSQVSEFTPFGEGGDLRRNWRENAETPAVASQMTITQSNRFDKPDWIERRDHEDKLVGRHVYTYDGQARCIRDDEELAAETRSTHYEYDIRGRVTRTRLPDQTLVARTFAAHSTGDLATAIKVSPGDNQEAELLVGERTFDGLQRLTSLTVGPRAETYEYDGQQTRVSKRTTPANKIIEYFYEADLSNQPKQIVAPDSTSTFGFDKDDGGIKGASNDAGTREYTYDALGHLQLERWIDADNSIHETRYECSLLGLATLRVDNGLETHYSYDDLGRLDGMTQGQLQADFEYDADGRQHRTTTRDLGSGDQLISENTYDSFDRITLRTLLLNDSPARTLTQVWRDDDQLHSRHLEMDGRSLLFEEFAYDVRGRLEEHHCSGERLPTDRYGNAITDQLFRFDALNNIERCQTIFANGETDSARYTYAEDDSCQLVNVKHTYTEGGYPASQDFSYDLDGNMLNDELGQSLEYDSQGRLLKVTSADGSQTTATYRYDGHQHLVGVREGDGPETLRFYQDFEVSYTVRDGVQVHYFRHAGQPLGQQELNDHERTMLLLTDASPSVIGESLAAGVREAVYSAYGAQAEEQRLECLLAFNGELRETANGWYLLGRGYRAYNPELMRFHSRDSLSPFGEGGLNPYMYCLGNPVRFRDPSGHYARGWDPDYIDPPEQPAQSKGWMDWIPVIFAVVAAVGITLGSWGTLSAPAWSMAFVIAAASTTTAVLAVGVSVLGVVMKDEELINIATIMTGAATVAAVGSGLKNKYDKHQQKKANAANEATDPNAGQQQSGNVAGDGTAHPVGGLNTESASTQIKPELVRRHSVPNDFSPSAPDQSQGRPLTPKPDYDGSSVSGSSGKTESPPPPRTKANQHKSGKPKEYAFGGKWNPLNGGWVQDKSQGNVPILL
ncbi:MAG: hypothetical protein LBJ37_28105 [Paucimonas sp.]|jgi:RHS repeat-associated protein|nr:hypothetical protein [Paucimonas sp.]